jgi:hypothetical protein
MSSFLYAQLPTHPHPLPQHANDPFTSFLILPPNSISLPRSAPKSKCPASFGGVVSVSSESFRPLLALYLAFTPLQMLRPSLTSYLFLFIFSSHFPAALSTTGGDKAGQEPDVFPDGEPVPICGQGSWTWEKNVEGNLKIYWHCAREEGGSLAIYFMPFGGS